MKFVTERMFVFACMHIALFSSVLWPASVSGVEFEWLAPANTQVIVLEDPHVDMALRVAGVDRARYSIDSVSYYQGIDAEIGMPLLQAFRRAHAYNENFKGRYLVERISALVEDPTNHLRRMLADSSLASPAEVISFGGLRNWIKGLRLTDFVHEKVLIIDRDTPNEMIILGGRNNSKHAIANLDLAIVLRPLIPGEPYIGDQIKEAFDRLWETTRKIHPPHKPRKRRLLPKFYDAAVVRLPTVAQWAEFERLNRFLSTPANPAVPMEEFEARPERMRLLTNDLLKQVLAKKMKRSLKARRAKLKSDIVRVAAEALEGSKKIYLSLMSVDLPEALKTSLKNALANGAEVHLITNSREAHRTHTPRGLAYEHSLGDIVELMRVNGRLNVYVLDEKILRANSKLRHMVTYLHRKLIVADQRVFTGSDNFNEPSLTNNSELALELEDARFSQMMAALLESDLRLFRKLTCEQALSDYHGYGLVERGLNRIFLPFY